MGSSQTLLSALWISLIGMGLVFAALLLLWGLLEVMVRITHRMGPEEPEEEITPPAIETDVSPVSNPRKRRMAAAAGAGAAMAVAVSREITAIPLAQATPSTQTNDTPIPAQKQSGAWQSTLRAHQINQNANLRAK